ncbi:actin-related protein 6 isoform X2 [Nymphaea colorata]|uniref:actin-related protein 6 isoform X2 n=1 Tax=Nymphaea colorata TaxID=210225 RepID=UPI00129E1A3C|nr:actin-related protein 6 isoform X2 [Nymphaea colorata]
MSLPSSVVVLDNGGGLCKAGIGGDRDPIAVVPNCMGRSSTGSHHHHGSNKSKKWLVADQLQDSDDVMSIRRPLDRGYLINPDLQKEIWDRIFKALLKVDPSDSSLLLVEPLFNLPSIQRSTDELVFEDFGFQSLYVADSPSLVHLYETSRCPPDRVMATSQCSLVVDCGFSFTHAAPVFQNFTLNYAVKRLDLGGKALTNYLKELVSYRSINVMDETFIMDDVKEKLCCVSLNVPRDLQVARKTGKDNLFRCSYTLPDGVAQLKGYVKDPKETQRYLTLADDTPADPPQGNIGESGELLEGDRSKDSRSIDLTNNEEIVLTNERFLVPEMLFHPADLVQLWVFGEVDHFWHLAQILKQCV